MSTSEERGWIRASVQLPKDGQVVYYFGHNIGIHIGTFDSTVPTTCYYEGADGQLVEEDMPQHVINSINHNKFLNRNWGVVDTDDAPWWMPYDEEHARSWVPLPPDYVIPD